MQNSFHSLSNLYFDPAGKTVGNTGSFGETLTVLKPLKPLKPHAVLSPF